MEENRAEFIHKTKRIAFMLYHEIQSPKSRKKRIFVIFLTYSDLFMEERQKMIYLRTSFALIYQQELF